MDAKAVVQQALEAGVALYLKDGTLAYKAIRGEFPEDLRALVRLHKPAVERYLSMLSAPASTPQPQMTARGQAKAALSYAQERLWAIDRLTGRSPYYNLPFAIEMKGECRADLIQRAIRQIVARHEALRTSYVEEGQEVYQLIRADYEVPFAMIDLGALPADEQQAQFEQLLAAEAGHAFDLRQDVLLRSCLVRLAPDVHVLLVNMHHIAADGWSIGLLVREFTQLYEAYAHGGDNPLPPLALQYSDYAHWQREHLSGAALDGHWAHWLPALAGLPQLHGLRSDRPRPPVFSYRGAAVESRVERGLMEGLQRLAQQANATMFIVMQAAMAVLLHRYSGERSIVIGTAVANREQAQIADLIGCFINMLVFKHDVDAQASFAQLLDQVRGRVLDGMAHQALPFEMLVEKLQPARTLSHSPLFQVAMVYQNNASETFALPGLEIGLLEQPVSVVKYDLTLVVKETPAGLRLSWEYASDLFEAETLERMAANFDVLLAAVVASGSTPIGALPLLSDEQRERSRHDTRGETFDTPASLPARFQAQVLATPDRIAVVCGDQQLSYDELNRRANRLAHWLRARGIGADDLVGLCVERSTDLMVCLLGILKAGAAYLPLDPGYPAARLEHMLRDSGARLVLTQTSLQAVLPLGGAQRVCLEDLADALAACADTDPDLTVAPAQLAYVIYTSGSTGVPKGVAVEHGNVANFLASMQDRPGFTADDRLLAVTPISFDIHVLELFLPLVSGGTVVLASREAAGDGEQLLQLLTAQSITVMQATPATWRLMLATDRWAAGGALKVLCGGEAMDRSLAEQLLPRTGELWNMYGPTETTVWSSCARILAGEEITIGHPIANTGLYVLNAQRQMQPVGVIGEVYIGGDGVARGYLGRPDLTAERFDADPVATDGSARMYRTGDYAYRRADGQLVYCERVDGQVKVRGFRIELDEIEHQLRQCPQLKAAVVVGDGDGGDRRLVAYVVPAEPAADLEATLRSQLRRHLPEYMVPAVFVQLDTLPLTPNGKVDRKALVAPVPTRAAAPEPPATPTEHEVARIWCEFLRLPSVSMTANFFEIGGHSLLGARMVTALNQRFGLALHLKDIFEFRTARELALHIDFLAAITRQESVAHSSAICEEEAEW